ncbi:hypothetical protein STA3757_48980 (plasmid) [Stanieria sp. NIES-3757]|nr:hypothetical protein STA3757_48980 [Stanieria sp. NIES-3757]
MTRIVERVTTTQGEKNLLEQKQKHLQLIENNYQHNLDTDYTEKIHELSDNFDYTQESDRYWSEPQLSFFYGTPLYEVASDSQKIALNQLNWVFKYHFVLFGETETIHYNQITGESFATLGENYRVIAEQLKHESAQERIHINAFSRINGQTVDTILGEPSYAKFTERLYRNSWQNSRFSNYADLTLRSLTQLLLRGNQPSYLQYLNNLTEQERLGFTASRGFAHGLGVVPQFLTRFLAYNQGTSPFLASQYYVIRYMANLLLKSYEHNIYKYWKTLQKKSELVPTPTAVSYYHLLDESFHTTTSLFLARDFYKHLSPPTAYEKLIANLVVYLIQSTSFSGLSAISRYSFLGDSRYLIGFIYKLLKNPLFGMSDREALDWMEKCFCQEHEGFYLSAKYHQRLLLELRRFTDNFDYLWAVNREMKVMAAGGSVSTAIAKNTQTFKRFARQINA